MNDATNTRAVSVAILQHTDGSYILQRRDLHAKNSPGKLGLFGGQIENEEPRDALFRELREEISLSIPKDHLKFFAMKSFDNLVVFYYLVRVESKTFSVFEGEGLEVLQKEEILNRDDIAYSAKDIFYDSKL